MTIKLQNAISRSNTFGELVPIAQQLTARISFWGRQYVIINPTIGNERLNYEEGAPLNAVLNRIKELMRVSHRGQCSPAKYSTEEHRQCYLLEKEITRFYKEDEAIYNRSRIITKIAILVRCFFRWTVSLGLMRADYQKEWKGDLGWQGKIIFGGEWDDRRHRFVPYSEMT